MKIENLVMIITLNVCVLKTYPVLAQFVWKNPKKVELAHHKIQTWYLWYKRQELYHYSTVLEVLI